MFRSGVIAVGPSVWTGKLFLTWSYRRPALNVIRPRVHLSCANRPVSRFTTMVCEKGTARTVTENGVGAAPTGVRNV